MSLPATPSRPPDVVCIVPRAANAYSGGSSGRDIFSHHFVFIFVLGESVPDQVPDRHQANEPLLADDREMAKPSIGHFFHGYMNELVLTRRDHLGGHVH